MKNLLLTLALVASTCMSALAATPVDHTKTYTFRTDTVYVQRDGLKIFGIAYIPEGQCLALKKVEYNQQPKSEK